MKGSVKLRGFLKGCLLQFFPLFLTAQVNPNMPIPPLPVEAVRAPMPPPGVPVAVPKTPIPPPGSPPVGPGSPYPVPFPPGAPVGENKPFPLQPEAVEEDRISDVLDFWFGFLPTPDFFPDDKMPIWFASTPEIDRQIRNFFSQDMLKAERGEYNWWRETPRGRLALILLLDQIPRHLYRNKPQSFVLDRMARAVVLEGLKKGDDKELYPIERAFFYLPLEHAEDIDLQNLSVQSYRQLLAESPEPLKLQMQDFLQSAISHQQQIARFGRFPYRNAVLGRESTPEETVYLMQWGRR